MNIVGLITEHNPFHNGHYYHLTKAKELTEAFGVVSIMSGNFLQRGEPALVNKWARAEMALKSGVDLVLELPTAFATRSAPAFSRGAVEILHCTGVVTHLCFGSEEGTLDLLEKLASLLAEEPPILQKTIREALSKGVVLPRARSEALEKYLSESGERSLVRTSLSPNNILGIEYLQALKALNSPIVPLTIKRIVAGYHDTQISPGQAIASATGIRKILLPGPDKPGTSPKVSNLMPPPSWAILHEEIMAGRGSVSVENLALPLLFALRKSLPTDLEEIIDVREGLENRIMAEAHKAVSYRELVERVKTKRFTWTRLQRILLHFLLGYNKTMAASFDQVGPQYIRVLGFTPKGRVILQHMRKAASLPVILHPAPYFRGKGILQEMLKLDTTATDLYCLLYDNPEFRRGGQDFVTKPIII